MTDDYGTLWAQSIARPMAEKWWAVALRGVVALLFGAVAFFLPGVTMLSLVLLFSAYALIDGVAEIYLATLCGRAGCGWRRWAPLLAGGAVSIAASAFALIWPQITVLVFVLILAAWSFVSGVMMLVQAARLETTHGRVWLALGGVASVLFGIALALAPVVGAVVLTWWLGAYALVLGGTLLAMAFRLRANRSVPPAAVIAGSTQARQ